MKAVFLFLWRVLDWLQQIVMAVTSAAIVVLILSQVTLRYVFNKPIMGVEELACLCGFWLYFTGSASGARERTHIKADLWNVIVSDQRTLVIINAVVGFLTVCLSALFVQWAFNYFQWSLKSWERSPSLGIPMIYAQASLLINAVLMLFYFIIEFLDYARQAMGYESFRFTGLSAAQTAASGE